MEKQQYFAHSIRAMEQFAYSMNRRVHIRHWALKDIPSYPQKGRRLPCYVQKGEYFHIYYPDTLSSDTKKIRMSIAHELGHLFFNTNKARSENYICDEANIAVEDVANIFGLLVLLGRSALYSGKIDVFGNMSQQDIASEYAKFCGI